MSRRPHRLRERRTSLALDDTALVDDLLALFDVGVITTVDDGDQLRYAPTEATDEAA